MSACEKCWNDAWERYYRYGGSHSKHYADLLKERADNPCTQEEQAGQWWDAERQVDTRSDHERRT